ncbi:MAG TPA: UDP-glucose/GDP-mannose dehydrogenase family protein [Terriglobales bacterium]|nr:UDP-glucose/GDP-mannose dehydrogenase family protein [Terriglobales bacterium]
MRIAVVGSGYVGLVASACLAEIGHDVVCIDNDQQKVAALVRGETPIHEQFLPELLTRHRGSRLRFSGNLAEAGRGAHVVFIAVGTPPTENGDADLSYVESVSREVGQQLGDYTVIVEKSTVPVYTCEWVRRVISLNAPSPVDFDVASNPEFLREGTAVTDFLYPDRIVVGADNDRSASVLRTLYEPLTSGAYYTQPGAIKQPSGGADFPPPLIVTSTKSAELIKHASNAFLALKISFINAVANVCEAVGADVEQVCTGVGLDSRIGPRFLRPGIGYGGSCFPKDVLAFRAVARDCGYDFRLLEEVTRINDDQRQRFLRKVRNTLWTLKGKRLAVLGLAFKGGTDDIRESPALALVQALLREGCDVVAYDPAAADRAREELGGDIVRFAKGPYEAARGADALLILTDWEEFARLDLERLAGELKYPIVLDGRNMYRPEDMAAHGLTYVSVGRATITPLNRRAAMASSPATARD